MTPIHRSPTLTVYRLDRECGGVMLFVVANGRYWTARPRDVDTEVRRLRAKHEA